LGIILSQRDNHPDDEQALSDARKSLADIEKERKQLERQEKHMTEWWADISIKRDEIQAKKHELNIAKTYVCRYASWHIFSHSRSSDTSNNHRKIVALEGEIKRLRDKLAELERRGPAPVEGGYRLFGQGHRPMTRTSPHTITPESIAAIVEKATKIPVQQLLSTDRSRLLNLETALSQQVCTFTLPSVK